MEKSLEDLEVASDAADIRVDEAKYTWKREMGQAPNTDTFVALKTTFQQSSPNKGKKMIRPRHMSRMDKETHK